MAAPRIRAVAFDLDGTLVDTEPLFERVVCEQLLQRGCALTHELGARMMGTPTVQAFAMLREHFGFDDSVEALTLESNQRLFALFDEMPVPLLPGVVELIELLDLRKVPFCIATSSIREHVQRVLGHHEVLHRFSFVMTCEDVTHGKPSPEIYVKTAAKFGVAPENMLVLEDSPNGLRAAKEAGAHCIVIPHARVPLDQLTLADAVLPSLAARELVDWLR